MSKKTEEIVINFKSDVKNMMSNLNKVKEGLTGVTNLKDFNKIDKVFDKITDEAKELFRILDQPIGTKKELEATIKKINAFKTSVNDFSKDLILLGKNTKTAFYDPKILESFDKAITKDAEAIQNLSNKLNKVRKEATEAQKALDNYDKSTAKASVLKRHEIDTKSYSSRKTNTKQDEVYNASQRISNLRELQKQEQSYNNNIERIEKQKLEFQEKLNKEKNIEVELDKEVATLRSRLKQAKQASDEIEYAPADKIKILGSQMNINKRTGMIREFEEGLTSGQWKEGSEEYKEFSDLVKQYKQEIKKFQAVIEEVKKSYTQGVEDPEQLKKQLKSASDKRTYRRRNIKQLQDSMFSLNEEKIVSTSNLEQTQKEIKEVGSIKQDIKTIKSFFSALKIDITDEELGQPEKVIEKMVNFFEKIEKEIQTEEANFRTEQRKILNARIETEREVTPQIESHQSNIQATKDLRQGYINEIDQSRGAIVSEIFPAQQNQNIEEKTELLRQQKEEELEQEAIEIQKQKEQEKADEEKRKAIEAQNKELDKQTTKYQTQRKSITDITKSLQDSLASQLKWTLSLTSIRSALKDIGSTIQELDDSFLSIAAVSDYSMSDMWDKYSDYSELANKVGQSTKDTIETSALWIQQGKEFDEAMTLTEHTIRLATISGQSFATVTQQMTSALQGFKLASDQAETVTDVYSELAAKAAADVDGIANAVAKVGALAYTSGMDLQTTAAMLTEMIETTQEAPSSCF